MNGNVETQRRCPPTERTPGNIVDCDSTNVSEPNEEGVCDCHVCGIWFRADEPDARTSAEEA